MTTPFTLGTPVPAILWSSLEDVLNTTMRLFAKDIAKTLGKPEAPLLQALQAEKIRPYILEVPEDAHDIDVCCEILCVKPDAPYFLQPCRNPICWTSTSKRCVEHLGRKSIRSFLPIVRRIDHEGTSLYVSEDFTVYSAENEVVGQYKEGKLTLFVIEDE